MMKILIATALAILLTSCTHSKDAYVTYSQMEDYVEIKKREAFVEQLIYDHYREYGVTDVSLYNFKCSPELADATECYAGYVSIPDGRISKKIPLRVLYYAEQGIWWRVSSDEWNNASSDEIWWRVRD